MQARLDALERARRRADRHRRHGLPLARRRQRSRRPSGSLLRDGVGRGRRGPGRALGRRRLLRPRSGAPGQDVHALRRVPRRRRPLRPAVLRHRAARGREHGPAAAPAARGDLGGARGRAARRRTGSRAAAPACSSGSAASDYAELQTPGRRPAADSTRTTPPGSAHSIAAGRLSYVLGLQGPSVASTPRARRRWWPLHLACQSLRARRVPTWRWPAAST